MVRTLQTLKCNKKEEIVNTPQPSGTEAQLLEAEFQQELKSLSERKRRTFKRYLKSQEKSKISFSFYLFSLACLGFFFRMVCVALFGQVSPIFEF